MNKYISCLKETKKKLCKDYLFHLWKHSYLPRVCQHSLYYFKTWKDEPDDESEHIFKLALKRWFPFNFESDLYYE